MLDAGATKVARYLEILQYECQRETSLINDLLDLSCLEAGDEPLQVTTLDLQLWIPIVAEPFIERACVQRQKLLIKLDAQLPSLTTEVSSS